MNQIFPVNSIEIKSEVRSIKSAWVPTLANDIKYISGFDPAVDILMIKELRRQSRKNSIVKIFNGKET